MAGFSGLFGCCFGTVLVLNSYCFARVVGGGGFRVFFGFLPVFGKFFAGGCVFPFPCVGELKNVKFTRVQILW